MNGATETKQIIINKLYEKVERLCNEGCTFGQVKAQELQDTIRRVGELDTKFWWLITICFITLLGVAVNLAVSYAQLNIKENIHMRYDQKYPLP